MAALHEAANICRLRNLDSRYGHYGSRGIVISSTLQNRAQGAQAWGDHGVEKLWSAANIKIYRGGVDDASIDAARPPPPDNRRLDDSITDNAVTDELDDGLTDHIEEAVEQPRNLYPNLYAFVAGFLADIDAREVSEQQRSWRWCSHWFHHTHAQPPAHLTQQGTSP